MNSVAPFVRHMLLCEDVRPSPTDQRKVNVYSLLSEIRSIVEEPVFPLRHIFSVYLAVTGGRGSGTAQIVITKADTGQTSYQGQSHAIQFGPDPLEVQGLIFRITQSSFPEPGLYWVEFRYNDSTIARQPLQVR